MVWPGWCHQGHRLHPQAFRAATRTLLLINDCRGFGARAGGQGEGARVRLPPELLDRVLALAAHPVLWAPQLRPHFTEFEREWYLFWVGSARAGVGLPATPPWGWL